MEDNKLYTTPFNAITDALREMDKLKSALRRKSSCTRS